MKVLQVIDSLAPAGAEMIVNQLASSLITQGIEIDIYSLLQTNSWIEGECGKQGIRIHYSSVGNLYSPLQAEVLNRYVLTNNYDLVHVHLFPAQLWTVVAAKLGRWAIPSITTEHNVTNRRRTVLFRRLDRWMYHQYDALVGVSQETSSSLDQWLNCTASSRISTIYNGVPLATIAGTAPSDLKRTLGLTDEVLAITVGRCEAVKNHECSIRAISRLDGVHLAIVGAGVRLPSLKELAASLGVNARVHFLGRRADVISLLKGADLYVQASFWEGFGVAAMEAMATGLPMVTTPVPGLREAVADVGLTFDPNDDAGLASCISLLASKPELRSRLSAASKDRALQFSVSKMANEYANLYQSVVRSRN